MNSKLLFIYGPLGGGGAERVLIDLLSNLDQEKYDIDLCLITGEGILLPEVPSYVNIIPLWPTYTNYYKLAFRLSKWGITDYLFKRVLAKKLSSKYDVEISFLEGMPLKLHALMNTSAKKITWVHCDLFNFHYTNKQFRKDEEAEAYNKMDKIICVSKDTLTTFEQRFLNCKVEKEVIYNPIDINKIQTLSNDAVASKTCKFTIVTVGRLTLQKKPERILRLASKFKKEGMNIHFQIIGDGELRESLRNMAKELNVEDVVEFLGFKKNPYPYIKNADIMMLCSGYEGFGLVICEAMCLGTPVIATKTAGPVEIIKNDTYGLLCEHDDESIYSAAIRMLKDDVMRTHYIKVGYDRTLEFKVERCVKRVDILIEQLLNTSKIK